MELTEAPIGADGAIGGFALDRTEAKEVITELARHTENHQQVLHTSGRQSPFLAPTGGLNFSTRLM
jgi:hypothetical protein